MLENKVAFVTGAAQGIGYAIAKEFAAQGANVALADYNEKEVKEVAKKMNAEYKGEIWPVVADVSKSAAVDKCIAEVVEHFGKIDYAINNAGGGILKPFAELTDEDFNKTVNVDFFGTFYCMRAEIKQFLKQGRFSIDTVSIWERGLQLQTAILFLFRCNYGGKSEINTIGKPGDKTGISRCNRSQHFFP